ncbi:hypothetical protein ElyMa_003695600 [Elysia marginata]|uniref:Uncharacterized protein n=1 Tax=Elysia marginata TaxID=1093978 RepID=A0AAV4F3G2_9GAST|nr:hypothetical protein ElyMa_003695600 [Elysia marginata]
MRMCVCVKEKERVVIGEISRDREERGRTRENDLLSCVLAPLSWNAERPPNLPQNCEQRRKTTFSRLSVTIATQITSLHSAEGSIIQGAHRGQTQNTVNPLFLSTANFTIYPSQYYAWSIFRKECGSIALIDTHQRADNLDGRVSTFEEYSGKNKNWEVTSQIVEVMDAGGTMV